MLQKILTKLGLSEKEAQIYNAALELGPETVQTIARKAGITRTGTYAHLRSLIKKGLMTSATRDKKTYFSAEPPENLAALIEVRKRETKALTADLYKLMPKLRLLFETTEERPRVRVFEGKEGLKTMTNDLLKTRISSLDEFTAIDEAYAVSPPQPGDHRERIKRKIRKYPRRIIYTSKQGPFLKPRDGLKERRFLPKEKFPFTGSVNIYGNKVALTGYRKTITGVIIENKEIADTMRTFFDLAWETAAKYKK